MDVGSMTTFFVSLDSVDVAAVLTLEAGKANPRECRWRRKKKDRLR